MSKVLKWRSLSTKGRYRAARAANKHRKIKLLSQYSGLLEGWVLQLNQFKRMLWVQCVYLLVQHLSHQANELHNQLYTIGFFFLQIQVIADALSWRPDIWSLYSGYFCCTWKEVGWREKHWLKHIFQEPSPIIPHSLYYAYYMRASRRLSYTLQMSISPPWLALFVPLSN